MKLWLKIGLIFAIIVAIIHIGGFICLSTGRNFECLLWFIPELLLVRVFGEGLYQSNYVNRFILVSGLYFLIGLVIGLVIDKIKSN